jgi:cation:H+ antiporter
LPTVEIALFVASAVVIIASGTRLPILGQRVAVRLGIGETALGLFVLAVVTSLPELSVTITAMLRERAPDLALGNVLGSNNFNATSIVFLEALFVGGWFLGAVDSRRYSRTCWLLLGMTGAVGAGVLLEYLWPSLLPSWVTALAFGALIVALFAWESKGGRGITLEDDIQTPAEGGEAGPAALAGFVALSLLVIAGGYALAWTGRTIAEYEFQLNGTTFRLGQTFVGTLFVAIATSLPEVSVAYGALRKAKSTDIALGTLLGSNSFNILVFAIGAPLLMLRGDGLSAWTVVSPVNMVNVVTALVLTLIVLVGMSERWCGKPSWQPKLLAAFMVPIYLVSIYLVGRFAG